MRHLDLVVGQEDLIEAAQHGDSTADPLDDAFTPEVDGFDNVDAYGEADREDDQSAADEESWTDAHRELIVVKPAVGFTLPSAGLSPAPSENRKMARTPFCSEVLFSCVRCHSERSEESRLFVTPKGCSHPHNVSRFTFFVILSAAKDLARSA